MTENIARLSGNVLLAALLLTAQALAGGCLQQDVQYRGMAAPPTEFLIGPEDVLVVTVWRNQELSKEVIVRPDGKISLPLLGDIMAAGLTAQALSKQVADGLVEFMASPTVSVQVKEINSYHVFAVGEVENPGRLFSSRLPVCSKQYPMRAVLPSSHPVIMFMSFVTSGTGKEKRSR